MSSTKPGGAAVSNLKKRRLAALSQALSSKADSSAPVPSAAKSIKGETGPAGKQQQQPAGRRQQRGKNRPNAQEPAPPSDVFPYNPLPNSILQGPVGRCLGLQSEGGKGVESLLQTLLSQGKQGMMGRNTGEIVAERIIDKVVVLDNPNTKAAIGSLKKKATQQYSTELLKGESKKEQFRKARLTASFTVMAKVHEVWQQYMSQQLGSNPTGCEEQLLQMDWHGAFVQVARCKQRQLEGVQGLVFHISKTTVHVVSANNRHYCIPLAASTLRVQLGEKFEAVVAGQNLMRAWSKQTPLPIKIS